MKYEVQFTTQFKKDLNFDLYYLYSSTTFYISAIGSVFKCYANYSSNTVEKNFGMHNPKSSLLFGEIDSTDAIKERKVKSLINNQMNLFDILEK